VTAGILVVAGVVAWIAAGALARRVQGARLPAVPDLAALNDAGRAQIREADGAARAAPTSPGAIGILAQAYHANLLMTEAVQAYAAAESLAPDDWRWTYYRALVAEERGEQDTARPLLDRVVDLQPRQGYAWFRIAEIAFKDGRLDEAAQAYARAREPLPPDVAPVAPAGVPPRKTLPLDVYGAFGLARVALERGERDHAREALEGLLKSHPTFASARALLAELSAGSPAATAALAAPPDAGRAYVPPADPLVDAVVGRSHHSDLLLKHAAMAARAGDGAWREFLIRRAHAANPQSLDVLLDMASLLQTSGRATEALDYLRRAEKVAPGDHHVLVEQGRSLSDLGRLDEAEAVLRRAVRVRDASAEYNLGTVLDRKGQWDEARQRYERALAIDPFHARAMNNLAVGLDRRRQTAAALDLYKRAIEVAPDHAETYSNLGSALIGARRFSEAIRALETSIALDADAPDARNNLGIALAQSGRFDEARVQFETALKIFPGHVNARRNLEQVRRR
jgi:tetratricopeptide (TPR) repeat protein